MTIATMEALGAVAMAARLIALGRDRDDVIEYLEERFPGETSSAYDAAWRRGAGAASAGQALGRMGEGERLAASQAPRPRAGQLGWRYNVIVEITDLGGAVIREAQVEVRSDRSLSQQEVVELAADRVEVWREQGRAGRSYGDVPESFQAHIVAIISVDRY